MIPPPAFLDIYKARGRIFNGFIECYVEET